MTTQDNLPPANVPDLAKSYNFGIIVRRWLGCWIDLAVFFSFFLIPDAALGNELYRQFLPVWLLAALAYFPLCEWRWGRTLGKVISGTIIVTADGQPPNLWQAIARTLLRVIEVNPFLLGGLPAGLVALSSKHRQRMGDAMAGTYVVVTKDLRHIQEVDSLC